MLLNLDEKTLSLRKPLWSALSDLFLDTELQDADLSYIALKMKESSYSLDEITDILMTEVFPVCISNLNPVAGIWEGFEGESLFREIVNAKPPNRFQRWFYQRKLWMIKEDWERVVEKFNAN